MELSRHDEDGAVVVAVSGDLDIATAARLLQEGRTALTGGTPVTLVLDLARLQFLDSSGIGTLVELRNVAIETDGALRLRAPSARTRRLLQITALDSVFAIEE